MFERQAICTQLCTHSNFPPKGQRTQRHTADIAYLPFCLYKGDQMAAVQLTGSKVGHQTDVWRVVMEPGRASICPQAVLYALLCVPYCILTTSRTTYYCTRFVADIKKTIISYSLLCASMLYSLACTLLHVHCPLNKVNCPASSVHI